MNIQYYGHSCFKMTVKPAGRGQEEVVLFIDPFDKSIGLRPPQGQADLALVTHDHPDHSNVAALKGEPTVIDLPGEYSIRGINIIGLQTYHDDKGGRERGLNTAFIIDTEEVKVCHLGDLGSEPGTKQLEAISEVDVLMIPIGGKYTIDYKQAVDLIRKVEPKIVIPMHYKIKGLTLDLDDEKKFCNEIGNCPREKVMKLNLKKSDLEGKSMQVVLMGIE